MYVTNQQDFNEFLELANKSEVVAIDTEFLRDKTYWPKLCLLQLAIHEKCILVDPFEVDIVQIKDLLLNKRVVKLFHSPRQDIEILLHETGVIPEPIFDTQIAAGFIGHNVQIGYGNLVSLELGIKLKKGDTYTDWSLRPLTESQLKYAKDDVVYLLEIYHKIVKKLKTMNRLDWVYEDINVKYLDKSVYEVSLEDRFWHLKRVSTLNRRQLACAKELASWREKIAIKKNIPRRWVISDEQIIEICKQQPKNIDALYTMRGAKSSLDIKDARGILDSVKRGLAYKDKDLPDIKDNKKFSIKAERCIDSEIDAEADLMCAIVRHRAKENNIAPQALSSNSDIAKIAYGATSGIPTLSGWRKRIVGNELLELMNGKLSLKLNNGKIVIQKDNESN